MITSLNEEWKQMIKVKLINEEQEEYLREVWNNLVNAKVWVNDPF